MRILFIEDNLDTIKGICDYAEDHDWQFEKCEFVHANEKIAIFDPELIVMDWMYDAEAIDEGLSIFNNVYSDNFRPVIIFSAVASTIELPEDMKNTPLVEIIPKGDEEIVIERINAWKPYITAVRNLKVDLNQSLLSSVQAIDNFLKMETPPGEDVIKYMLNKRTTYYFDKEYIGEEPPAWIQYEYPPIQKSLLVADILRVYSEKTNISAPGYPEEYRIVLTPSCDMARAKPGQTILVAKCTEAIDFSDGIKLGENEAIESKGAQNKIEKISRFLNTGYNYSRVALPELPNKIPYLTINLKSIEQISLDEIAISEKALNTTKKYFRVASIVSPFREQIVWAHMINSCRPGMPERDIKAWAKGILLQ